MKRVVNLLFAALAAPSLLFVSCAGKADTKSANFNNVNEEGSEKKSVKLIKDQSIEDYLKQLDNKKGPSDRIVTESLWNERYSTGLLFVDHKARQIGDIVTVEIVETSSASKDASTKTSRDSSIEGGIDSLFGVPTNLGMKNFLNSGQPFSPNLKADYKNSFNGSGSTSRSGKITATISAHVVELLENGNLKIFGHREIKVNQENQIIAVTGVIRPQDISETNSVKSTAIAEAKIEYFGKGVIADKQSPGWLARFIDVIWPF